MKKVLSFLWILLIAMTAFGQQLTLNDLSSMCSKENWALVNETLLANNWEFNSSSKSDDGINNTITWTYNKTYEDRAEGWLYLFTNNNIPGKIRYFVCNKQAYDIIQRNIKSNGYQLIDSDINANELTTKFTNANFNLEVKLTNNEADEYYTQTLSTYTITLTKKFSIYDSDNGEKIEYSSDGQYIVSKYNLKNGKLEGRVIKFYPNGQIAIDGNYKNGLGNGKFSEYDEDGRITTEYFKVNNEINGLYKSYEPGITTIIEIVNGLKNGSFTQNYYNDSGTLYIERKGEFINDLPSGKWETTRFYSDNSSEIIEYTSYLNGKKNGPFKEYSNTGDTLRIGSYKNDVLDGPFEMRVKYEYTTNNSSEESSLWLIHSEGLYKDGNQNGKWTFYLLGLKSNEGNFLCGKKDGKWISYVVIGDKSGEIEEVEYYTNGALNGVVTRFLYSDSYDDGNMYKFKSRPVFELTNYKNNKKDGEYVLKDSLGITLSKGEYQNDKKVGFWIESEIVNLSDTSIRVFQKGIYSSYGLKESVWEESLDGEYVYKDYSYKSGILHGPSIIYNGSDKPKEKKFYKAGSLSKIEVFDSLGTRIEREYEIISSIDTVVFIQFKSYSDNVEIDQLFRWSIDYKNLDHDFFDGLFLISSLNSKQSKLVKSGASSYYEKDKNIISEGSWDKDIKNGLWKINFLNDNIQQQLIYQKGNITNECFYVLDTQKAYSGTLKIAYSDDNSVEVIKIKSGLRDGTTKFFNNEGKVIKEVKYVKGALK